MSFTAAGLAAARAVRDAFTVVGEVIDALIPAEAIDQAEALAKAEERREVWEPGELSCGHPNYGNSDPDCVPLLRPVRGDHPRLSPRIDKSGLRIGTSLFDDLLRTVADLAACGGDADAGSSHPTSAPSAKQLDAAPHTDSAAAPHRGTPGGETPRSAAGHPPGHLTSYDASWAAAIVQSRGLDLPLGSRARAAVLSLAERLDVLAKELSQ